MSLEDIGHRVVSERTRLGFTLEQFAVLVGVSKETQEAIESGKAGRWSVFYGHAAQAVGADPMFMLGESEEPRVKDQTHGHIDESFIEAIDLLRRSMGAVEAFVGMGKSRECPQLVAALMSATLQSRYAVGPGEMENFSDTIARAIDGLSEVVDGALGAKETP